MTLLMLAKFKDKDKKEIQSGEVDKALEKAFCLPQTEELPSQELEEEKTLDEMT